MDPRQTSSSEIELTIRRERIRRGLTRANTAALLALLIVVALSLAAIRQAFQAQHNAQEAGQAQRYAEQKMQQARAAEARALLQQVRAQRRTGEAGQRFGSIAAASEAAVVFPSAELRDEVIAALALPDVSFVSLWTNRSPNLVTQFSPAFDLLAIGATGGKIEMVRIDGTQGDVLPSAGAAVLQLRFSSDERFLAAQYSSTNVLWDLSARRIVRVSDAQEIFGAFTADSRSMLVVDNSGTVRRLEIPSGKELWHFDGGSDSTYFDVQPQDAYFTVFASGESKVQIRRLASGELVAEIAQPLAVGAVAWSPDGKTLVVGRNSGWIDTWQTESWTQTGKWKAHNDTVVSLAFEPAGERLASSSWDGTVRFWSVPGYQSELSVSGYQSHTIGRLSPDGHRYSCVHEGEHIGFLQLADSPVFRRFYVPTAQERGAWSLDITADGKLLAAGYEDGLLLLDFATGRQLDWKPIPDCRSVMFAPDGRELVTCGNKGIACWSVTGKADSIRLGEPRSLPERRELVHGALSADGQWVAAAIRRQGVIAVHNLKNPAEAFDLTNHARVQFVDLSSDGRWLASGTRGGTGVKVWNLRSRQFVRELPVRGSSGVTFSPDNKFLITGSLSYQVWECGSWRELYTHAGVGGVGATAFSPDGTILAVLKNPHTMDLLEPATGRVFAEFEAPDSVPIWALRFSPDGQKLLALECEHQIQVWDLKNIHQELARLGLDWETEDIAQSKQIPQMPLVQARTGVGPAVTTPSSAFYFLALGGVFFSVLIGIYTLRYNYRMIRSYEEVENLVTRGNEELKSARIELLQNQKMRALGTLAAGIAHDFNNLLSVIRMSNKLVDRKARNRSGIQEHVSDIEQAVLQGKTLVGSMLGYARNETSTSGPVDVSAVVENAVSLLSKEFLSGIALSLELDRNAPKVELGNSRLEQILLNLLVNASEAMEGKGNLTIRLQTCASLPSRPYVLRPQPAEEFLELTVIDSGPGIAPEIKDRLFEPFFTTKNSRSKPGTGLGLSLVYSIAQEDGLGLSVENAPERGAAFSVVMPVHSVAPVRERHSSQIAIKA